MGNNSTAAPEGNIPRMVRSHDIHLNSDYVAWIQDVKKRFRSARIKAAVKVNSEQLLFNWELGRDLVERKAEETLGRGIVEQVSLDLQNEFPGVQGFSTRNLWNMKKWYLFYSADEHREKLQQLVAEFFAIPWSHHIRIIDKCKKDSAKALFYVHQTYQNGWSRDVLLNFLDTNLYERAGKAITNFSTTMPAVDSDLAQQLTKDPYQFDFFKLKDRYKESELKDELVKNIEKFLLELGRGFAYMGREYRLEVDGEEMFIDMLFYNVPLHRYVVVEIKTGKLESANVGQLGGYVVAVNHMLNTPQDNPAIGLLICKEKNDILAQYALESSSQPLGISQYQLAKLIPDDFRGTMPTIEEIENELNDNNIDI